MSYFTYSFNLYIGPVVATVKPLLNWFEKGGFAFMLLTVQ